MNQQSRRSLLACAALTALAFALPGCGYSLAGRGSFLPDYIRVIGIPMFANRTPLFNLETQLTEKVRAEFIGRGKYKIMPDAQNVDALLNGEVTGVNISPLSFTNQQLASRYLITMSARVELRDQRANTVLWENPALIFRQEYEATQALAPGQTPDPNAFFGQDQNALDRMTTEFSRSIVSAILEAF